MKTYSIGRDLGCDVVVNDTTDVVSRRHARFFCGVQYNTLKNSHKYENIRIFAQNLKNTNMKDYLRKLHVLRLFSLQDATEITGNESTAKSMLAAAIRNGMVCRVKSNLYAVTDLATSQCIANKFEIASHISETACVAYHSAMEYHGLGHQLFNEVTVFSASSFRPFDFDGLVYVRRQPTIQDGVVTPLMNSSVRVTDLERTIIDCIDRIKYAGGVEELLNNLSSVSYVAEIKLLTYLDAYGKASLYQKTGFLLSRYRKQWRLSESFFRHCKANIGKSTCYLAEPSGNTKYDAEWRLCLSPGLSELKEKGGSYV